jgi:hypothetical protein
MEPLWGSLGHLEKALTGTNWGEALDEAAARAEAALTDSVAPPTRTRRRFGRGSRA